MSKIVNTAVKYTCISISSNLKYTTDNQKGFMLINVIIQHQ